MVSRRRTLQLAGTGLLGLAGCVGGGDDSPSGSNEPGTTDSTPPGDQPPRTTAPGDAGTDDGETDAHDGDVRVEVDGATPSWSRDVGATVEGDPVSADGHVVLAAGSTLLGLDADTGETAWTLDAPSSPTQEHARVDASLRVHDGVVYALLGVSRGVTGGEYTLLSLDPDGTERWRYRSGIDRFHEFAGLGGGTAVIPTHDDALSTGGEQVVAVDLASGEERWRADTGDGLTGAVGDDVAILEVVDQVLDCFDLASGDRRFRFDPVGDLSAGTVGGGRVFVAAPRMGGDGPTLYALDPADGEVAWRQADPVASTVRYLDDLYVGGKALRRLGPDGEERWRYDAGGFVTDVPFDDERLFTVTDARLVAVDRADGSERWDRSATDRTRPVTRGGDSVVVTEVDTKTVSALSVDDGAERWQASLTAEGGVWLGTGGGGAFLATSTGSVVWVPV